MNVVGSPGDRPEYDLTVNVQVNDRRGVGVRGVPVILEDLSSGQVEGYTDTDGRVQFIEPVGPRPCNTISVVLPNHGVDDELGCFNGPDGPVSEKYTIQRFFPSDVNIIDCSGPTVIDRGQMMDLRATVENQNDEQADVTLLWRAAGRNLTSEQGTVPAEGTQSISTAAAYNGSESSFGLEVFLDRVDRA
jgi:hypothetical protein